jgi:hypothetical protein
MLSEKPNMPEEMKKIYEYSQILYEKMESEREKIKHDEKMYDELARTKYDSILKEYKYCKLKLNNKMLVRNELGRW